MLAIHPNARTTPAVRAEIARSGELTGELARRYGVSTETVRKWRKRGVAECRNRSSRPHKLPWKASGEERAVVCALRRATGFPLDDLTFIVAHFLPHLGRDDVYRILKAAGLSRRPAPTKPESVTGKLKEYELGFVHVDVKHLPKPRTADGECRKRYLFVAIDRRSRSADTRDVRRGCGCRGCSRGGPRPPRSPWSGSRAVRRCPGPARGKRASCSRDRRRPTAARGGAGRGARAPAAARALGPGPARRRPRGPARRRSRTPWCRSRRASGRAPRAGPVRARSPFFGRTRGLGVRPDRGPVENRHAELAPARLPRFEQPLPRPEPGPADEELGRPPPGAELGRDRPPLRAVRVPPDDRLHRPPQVPGRRLALRPARLQERLQRRPPLVRQHHHWPIPLPSMSRDRWGQTSSPNRA